MGFKCLNCGKCCDDPLVQINLSFKDVQRMSKALKLKVEQLFSKRIIGFNPFIDPETGKYDIELGLNKPCKLRKKGKCSIYKSRPLNCRIFPYWLIAKFGNGAKDMFEPGFKGVHAMSISEQERAEYETYSKPIGEMLLKEANITDTKVNRIKQELGWEPGGIDAGGILQNHELEKQRIEAMKQLIEKLPIRKLRERVIKEIESL